MIQKWTTKLQGCLLFDFPVAKFANHDPSANIAPGIDSDLPPASSPAPVPVPFPESSAAPPDFEAFWLKKRKCINYCHNFDVTNNNGYLEREDGQNVI